MLSFGLKNHILLEAKKGKEKKERTVEKKECERETEKKMFFLSFYEVHSLTYNSPVNYYSLLKFFYRHSAVVVLKNAKVFFPR